MTDEQTEIKPAIVLTFKEIGSAEVSMRIENCSAFQIWGAARMLDQYAADLWAQTQMQQAMAQQAAEREAAGGPQLVRAAALPQDHLPRRNGRN